MSLVVMRDHVLLLRNGDPWVLAGAAPANFTNLPGSGACVFSELGEIQESTGLPWRRISTGFIEQPKVH